ncbi:olfactory receptor 1G1-like [Pleurodeles waltl]|uniref:olfactory receptor 1G1-like n=1 Tax=Pleurodeles waltl TaxID=8319 RepID=UPI0037099114
MNKGNLSTIEDFLIIGFSDLPLLQFPLFVAFLMIYFVTLGGNLLVFATIYFNLQLHTPMYFFLIQLSILDIIYTSDIFPQMLVHFFLEGALVSLKGCLLQMYLFLAMASVESLLLTVMAYDRYVAICHPLQYLYIINKDMCVLLVAGSWALGLINAIPHTALVSTLSFCASHNIDHFFCDITALMKISCTSTRGIEILTYIIGVLGALISCIPIVISYINIALAILKIKSKGGRQKAMSTCASHLTMVFLLYTSFCSMYMRPASIYSMKENKILSLSYIAVTPMCNPIIYSLKNTELKNAVMKRGLRRRSW